MRECSSMVELQLPKLVARVRFPSLALCGIWRFSGVSRPLCFFSPLGGHRRVGCQRPVLGVALETIGHRRDRAPASSDHPRPMPLRTEPAALPDGVPSSRTLADHSCATADPGCLVAGAAPRRWVDGRLLRTGYRTGRQGRHTLCVRRSHTRSTRGHRGCCVRWRGLRTDPDGNRRHVCGCDHRRHHHQEPPPLSGASLVDPLPTAPLVTSTSPLLVGVGERVQPADREW